MSIFTHTHTHTHAHTHAHTHKQGDMEVRTMMNTLKGRISEMEKEMILVSVCVCV